MELAKVGGTRHVGHTAVILQGDWIIALPQNLQRQARGDVWVLVQKGLQQGPVASIRASNNAQLMGCSRGRSYRLAGKECGYVVVRVVRTGPKSPGVVRLKRALFVKNTTAMRVGLHPSGVWAATVARCFNRGIVVYRWSQRQHYSTLGELLVHKQVNNCNRHFLTAGHWQYPSIFVLQAVKDRGSQCLKSPPLPIAS
jgi:hypothetical protein